MSIKKIDRIVGKWQIVVAGGHHPYFNDPFVRQFIFGVFKITHLPDEGNKLTKKHYNGLIIGIVYWFPIAKA